MLLSKSWLLFACATLALISLAESRRVRVRPIAQEQEADDTIQYYAAEPQDDEQQQRGIVYVTSDQYNGLYGQAASPRVAHDNYIQPSPRPASAAAAKAARTKETTRAPPVQTIRNYNKVNDDGSFTFGYEAADGSFKEETRGTDCVVRGKYGYIDPDGNKREFTYVSGNPCDPNAVDEEEKEREQASNEPENIPANYPIRAPQPRPRPAPTPVAHKAPVTFFQTAYDQEEDEQPEPEQVLRVNPAQAHRQAQRVLPHRPQYEEQAQHEVVQHRPRVPQYQPTTPASVIYQNTPLSITPRPVTAAPARNTIPTTYRPQLVQVAVTPRPALLYTKQIQATPRPIHSTPQPDLSATRATIDFAAEFQKFQSENAVTPKTHNLKSEKPSGPAGQIYSSELVFDPATGQYNTQLYQTLPQNGGDFSLNHRIQPYVHQPNPTQHTPQLLTLQQLQQQQQQQPQPLYRQLRPEPQVQPSQITYQQQQAGLQFQNSANLYARQQKAQQEYQRVAKQQQPAPQNYYYIQPQQQQGQQSSHNLAGGQIDAFLRGHNIQF